MALQMSYVYMILEFKLANLDQISDCEPLKNDKKSNFRNKRTNFLYQTKIYHQNKFQLHSTND